MMTMTVMTRHLKRNQRSSHMLWILTIAYSCGRANHFFKAEMLQWVFDFTYSVLCFVELLITWLLWEMNVIFHCFWHSLVDQKVLLLINLQVVMAVARVYHHLAPTDEVSIVARSLVRLLRSHRLDYQTLWFSTSYYNSFMQLWLVYIIDKYKLWKQNSSLYSYFILKIQSCRKDFIYCFHSYENTSRTRNICILCTYHQIFGTNMNQNKCTDIRLQGKFVKFDVLVKNYYRVYTTYIINNCVCPLDSVLSKQGKSVMFSK